MSSQSMQKELFKRNLGPLTQTQQHTLQTSAATVIGCGGLGGHVIEQLVRIGIGTLYCFDPDVFSQSNINRQLNATTATIGRNKADVAADRVSAIHRFTQVVAFPFDFRAADTEKPFSAQVIIDCLDSIEARRDLVNRCRQHNRMLVHGAVNGFSGQVGVQSPAGDLLSRLYPPHADDTRPSPSVLACTVALIASIQVAEAVKIILKLPSFLTDAWLYADLMDCEFTINR